MITQLVIVAFIIVPSDVLGTLVVVPQNVAQTIGNNVTFECQTNSTDVILWLMEDLHNEDTAHVIYDGSHVTSKFQERFSVTPTSDGRFDLFINSTDQVDPGTYICVENATGENASAEFVVLAAVSPNCLVNVSDPMLDDVVNLTCKVFFNGSLCLRPYVRWSQQNESVSDYPNYVHVPNVMVMSNYCITAHSPRLETYTCQLYFEPPVEGSHQPPNLATNTPAFTSHCVSQDIELAYGPVNTTITGVTENSTIDINTLLNCTSIGNPPPTYSWLDENSRGSQNGPVFITSEIGLRIITCTASNIIQGRVYSDSYTVSVNVVGLPPATSDQPPSELLSGGGSAIGKNV